MTDAYMSWDLKRTKPMPSPAEPEDGGDYPVRVVDVFGARFLSSWRNNGLTGFTVTYSDVLHLSPEDPYVGCGFIRSGLMPTAPIRPTVAVTIQALELYRLAHFRCPRLSLSAFVKALADIHGVSSLFLVIGQLSSRAEIASVQEISRTPVLHCVRRISCHPGRGGPAGQEGALSRTYRLAPATRLPRVYL